MVAEDVVDDVELQDVGFGLIHDAERRVEAGLGGVGAEQRRAEGVDRADAGGVDFAEMAEPAFLRFGRVGLLQFVEAGAADAGPHFAGGGVGEGDGDELAEAGVLGVGVFGCVEVREEAFGEDECFAATGAGGEGHRVLAAVEGGALFGLVEVRALGTGSVGR